MHPDAITAPTTSATIGPAFSPALNPDTTDHALQPLLEAAVGGDLQAIRSLADQLWHQPAPEPGADAHRPVGRADSLMLSSLLLVVTCTQRKATETELIPAIERYEGSCVPQVRELLHRRPGLMSRVRFLSAEHGWLKATTPIAPYDRRLSRERAHQLTPSVWASAGPELTRPTLSEVLLIAEPLYLSLLTELLNAPVRPRIHWLWDVHDAWTSAETVLSEWGW